jgi:hypothetical protein
MRLERRLAFLSKRKKQDSRKAQWRTGMQLHLLAVCAISCVIATGGALAKVSLAVDGPAALQVLLCTLWARKWPN